MMHTSSLKAFKPSYITLIITAILFLNVNSGWAQNTVSPYSVYGPGEIQSRGFGTNQGMGGAGIALKSGNFINSLNPASYVGMDSLRIISEFGIAAKAYNLSSYQSNQNGFTGNLSHIGIGFKYTRWLAGSFGVVPFSTINYTIVKDNYVEGLNSPYVSTYTGSGGISQFYFGNAVKLGKHLSLGANLSYMFGSLTQDEAIQATAVVPEMLITRIDYMRSLYVDFGLQTNFKVDKTEYSLGLTYAPHQKLNSKHVINVYDYNYSLIETDEEDLDYLSVPDVAGIGLGMVNPGKYKIALDYVYQNWSGVHYPNQQDEFNDMHKVVLGLEVNPWEKRAVNAFFKNWTYRMGFDYVNSYLKLDNSSIIKKSATLGVGIPLPGMISDVNFSVKGGVNGTKANKLVQEKYLVFNLGFSLNEIAFVRRKFD
ncbi:hypothetical protein [Maribellus sediminis]|uniref:hypothetical protein n=1 Tax=Maribellus sediminis TaxID=2696285 RepID=UPI00143138F4|nr:hypothetical protein [Maribellus sediminis]